MVISSFLQRQLSTVGANHPELSWNSSMVRYLPGRRYIRGSSLRLTACERGMEGIPGEKQQQNVVGGGGGGGGGHMY